MGEPRATVLARFKAKEGLEAEAEQAIAACVSPTRAEAGCINYDLHRSHDDKGTFILYENWAYLRTLKAKATELFVGPIDVSLWERI